MPKITLLGRLFACFARFSRNLIGSPHPLRSDFLIASLCRVRHSSGNPSGTNRLTTRFFGVFLGSTRPYNLSQLFHLLLRPAAAIFAIFFAPYFFRPMLAAMASARSLLIPLRFWMDLLSFWNLPPPPSLIDFAKLITSHLYQPSLKWVLILCVLALLLCPHLGHITPLSW